MSLARRVVPLLLCAAALVACSGPEATVSPVRSTSASPGALPWPGMPTAAVPAADATALQAELDRWVEMSFFPGVTAAVVSPGGVWSGAAGVDGSGVALEARSGMALASITKTFVAAEVMLLAEQGKVDLDAPASTYLDVPWVSNGVTVRQLLNQRSGISDPPDESLEDLFTHPNAHWSPEQLLAAVTVPTEAPDQRFEYANPNYTLLGLLVDEVTGLDVAAALDRDLWTPLGLERLAFQDQESLPAPLAAPRDDDFLPDTADSGTYLPFRSWASAAGAAGGVAGDAETAARWGYALYGALLLEPRSVTQMTDMDPSEPYGLGTMNFRHEHWFTSYIDGYGHQGETVGYRTVLAVYPERRLSIAVLTPSTAETVGYVRYLAKLVP